MHQLLITEWLNHVFAAPVDGILRMLGIHPAHPKAPIPNHVAMQLVVVLILTAFFIVVRLRLSVESPSGPQHVIEAIHEFSAGLGRDLIGPHYPEYLPYLMVLGMFILTANLLGLIPGLESPTGITAVPLGCALATWFYYHFKGLKRNGPVGYVKLFMGPVWWLAPLMLPIEIFSHLGRILSLTVRLFANMFAGEMVTLVFFSLLPIGVPVLFQGLHIGVSFIQTYIFVLLACVYLGEATAHEH